MIDDGRTLVLLAAAGLAAAGAVRQRARLSSLYSLLSTGSRGVVRSRRSSTRFVQLEPYQTLVDDTDYLNRPIQIPTWWVRVPGKKEPVRALNIHKNPDLIEVFWDKRRGRVVFWTTQKASPNAQIEVHLDEGGMLYSRNPLDPKEHVPFSQDFPRLEALMDEIDQSQGIYDWPGHLDPKKVLELARSARIVIDAGVTPAAKRSYSVTIQIGISRRDATIVAIGKASTRKTADVYRRRAEEERLAYTIPVAIYHLDGDYKPPYQLWMPSLAKTKTLLLPAPQIPKEIEVLLEQQGSRGVVRRGRVTTTVSWVRKTGGGPLSVETPDGVYRINGVPGHGFFAIYPTDGTHRPLHPEDLDLDHRSFEREERAQRFVEQHLAKRGIVFDRGGSKGIVRRRAGPDDFFVIVTDLGDLHHPPTWTGLFTDFLEDNELDEGEKDRLRRDGEIVLGGGAAPLVSIRKCRPATSKKTLEWLRKQPWWREA